MFSLITKRPYRKQRDGQLCVTSGSEKKSLQIFRYGNPKNIDSRIKLKQNFVSVRLVCDGVKWRDPVNTEMKFHALYNAKNFVIKCKSPLLLKVPISSLVS
jgi:hypothetical protein